MCLYLSLTTAPTTLVQDQASVHAHLQSSSRTIKGLWDQINSALKSLHLVVESKAKDDKHLKAAHVLRIEGHTRVLEILNREKVQVLEAFKRAGGGAATGPQDPGANPDHADFWARIGELDATIEKVGGWAGV